MCQIYCHAESLATHCNCSWPELYLPTNTDGRNIALSGLSSSRLCQLITLIHSGSKPKFLTNKSPCNTSAHFSNKDRQCYDHTMHQFDSHEKYKIG